MADKEKKGKTSTFGNSSSSMRKVCPWYIVVRSDQSDESIGKKSHAAWKNRRFYRDVWKFHCLAK